MTYVALFTWRANLSEERRINGFSRRHGYQYPASMKVLAEYWPASPGAAAIVLGFEAESFEPIMQLTIDWQDLFDVTVYPAITPEAGFAMGEKLMQSAA